MRKLLVMVALLVANAAVQAEVIYIDILPSAEIVAEPGDIVVVQYHVYPVDEESAQYCGLQAYITWDPECLALLDWEEGDYAWWSYSPGWVMSGAGGAINATWDDGDALLMLFDDPLDDEIPTAPHHSFSLLFYVLEPGCVTIDEWWCPPGAECPPVVPICTRISDLTGRPCERELGKACVVEDDGPEDFGDVKVKQGDAKKTE